MLITKIMPQQYWISLINSEWSDIVIHVQCILFVFLQLKSLAMQYGFLKSKVQIYIRHTYSYVGYAFILHVKLCIHIFSHLHACGQVLSRAGRYCNFSGRYIVSKKTRDITIYRGFYISLGLTVLLECFNLFH